jgi:hypothetical protein
MCPGDSIFIGVNCPYDTCFTLTVGPAPQVGIDELNSDFAYDVFPNPASDIINIYSESQILSVELLNILGEKVSAYEADAHYAQIPVSNISRGAYWVKIVSANRKPVFRKIQVSH